MTPLYEEFEDTEWVIRIRIAKKNRQHNGQKKMYKRTNKDLQNIHIRLGPPISSTNKTDRHDITEILLKVVLSTIKQANKHTFLIAPCGRIY
jgi:hypothetical protein